MNDLQIFNSLEFGRIRTSEINGEPYFVGKDVAAALRYKDTSDTLKRHVDEEDKLRRRFADSGQNREMYIINESGLYSLILSSKLPTAKKFKRWVTLEILPAIRKTGSYGKTEDDTRRWLATLIIQASNEKLEYLRRLYPEYLGNRPAITFAMNDNSFKAWVSDISGDKNYICSVPTAQLYSEYFCFCDFNSFLPMGKKIFYKSIENEFGLTRCQKSDDYRHFIGGEHREISGS